MEQHGIEPEAPSSSAAAHGAATSDPQSPALDPEAFDPLNVIARGFAIYARNFFPITSIALVLALPSIAASVIDGLDLFASIASMITTPIATAACVVAVANAVRGRPIRFVDSVRAVSPRVLTVVGAACVVSVVVGVGTLFCVVPGLYLMSLLLVVQPAIILEQRKLSGVLDRSAALTAGHRLACVGIALAPMVFAIVPSAVTFAFTDVDASIHLGMRSLGSVLSTSTMAVFATIAYIDLRAAKEPGFKGAALDEALVHVAPQAHR